MFAVMRFTGIGCFIKHFTGIPCPGCGITRALFALLRLDFASAFNYNPLIFCMPYVFAYIFFDFKNKRLHNIILAFIGTFAVINWGLNVFETLFNI